MTLFFEIFFLFFYELYLLIDLLIVFVVLNIEAVIEFLNFSEFFLLCFFKSALELIDLSPKLKHILIFLSIFFEELFIAVFYFL